MAALRNIKNNNNISLKDVYEMVLRVDNRLDHEQFLKSIQAQSSNVKEKKSYTSIKVDELLQRLDNESSKLVTYFEDLEQRLISFVKIKLILEELTSLSEQNIGFNKVCIILYDAVRKYKAEDLKEEQITVIFEICKLIVENEISEHDYIEIDDKLLDVDLCWVMGSD